MKLELNQQFLRASDKEKAAILLAYAVRMTIMARESYGQIDELSRNCNETIHKIASQALALTIGSTKRYPDDVFIEMIIAGAEQKGWIVELARAFKEANAT